MRDNRPIKVVYLGGPIDDVSAKESKSWRMKAYDQLSQLGILCAVPGLETIKMTPEQIVQLDDTMITASDALIVNLSYLMQPMTKWIGTGTLVELGLGYAQNKRSIAFSDKPFPGHTFYFLRGMCKPLYPSLEEAIAVVERINNGKEAYYIKG